MSGGSGHEHPLADLQRDVLALLRCATKNDLEGARVIAEHTSCPHCLALQTALAAISLAAHMVPREFADGGYSDEEAKALVRAIVESSHFTYAQYEPGSGESI